MSAKTRVPKRIATAIINFCAEVLCLVSELDISL